MMKKMMITLVSLSIGMCLPVAGLAFSVGDNPGGPDPAFDIFTKYVNVFGVPIYASSTVPDAKVSHAANVMAEYLDNNENGQVDNQSVVSQLTQDQAILFMFNTQQEHESAGFEDSISPDVLDTITMQPLYGEETHPEGSGSGVFDATLEEVLHLITQVGFAGAYPDVFGERRGTTLALAMDEAKTGGYYNPEANEAGLPYEVQISEYIYWALTSILGGQSYSGRLEEIRDEWNLNTKDKVMQYNPAGYALLTDQTYLLPQILPDGNYETDLVKNDFNGDGKADILYRHPDTGKIGVWLMDGVTETSWKYVGNHGGAWDAKGSADFDGDGYQDVLYRHSGGDVGLWLMNGVTETAWQPLTDRNGHQPANHGSWDVKGVADFDNDGRTDVLYRDPGSGNIGIWFMNGTTEISWTYVGNHGVDWDVKGVGDFNDDGYSDILYRNSSGQIGVWFMIGATESTWKYIGNHGAAWDVRGVADYDNDGRIDVVYRNPSGNVGVWFMNGTTETAWKFIGNHGAWDIR